MKTGKRKGTKTGGPTRTWRDIKKQRKQRTKQPPTKTSRPTQAERAEPSEPSCSCESAGCGSTDKSVNAELLAVTRPSLAECQQQSATDQIVFVKQPANLKRINRDTVQLAVWRRATVPEFVTALADPSIAAAGLPTFMGTMKPDAVAQKMKKRLLSQKQRALTDDGIDELVNDVDQLVRIFAKISNSKTVFVKLEVFDDDGCVFWHQDSVPFRLIATYRGPCTEWVHPDFSQATLRRRRFDSNHAQSLSHHDVALFKGRGESPEESTLLGHPGIVHRSPRISGSGIHRVVLTLNNPAFGG